MTAKCLPASVALGLAISSMHAAYAAEPVRGVVELFTSQGCSSCPPADRYVGELAKDPGLVVLSWPVDYWDYIGWKDTFAQPAFTARQKGYAAARQSSEVYTPQVIVDGVAHAVGSDRDHVEEELANNAKTLSAVLTMRESNGKIVIDVGPKAAANGSATLWLMRVLRKADVAIGRGENRGHNVSYTNVVREAVRLGEWSGGPAHFEAAEPKLGEGEGLVALLQTGSAARPGAILAAAQE